MSGGPLEALLKEQVRFNGIVRNALTDLKHSSDRMISMLEEMGQGELVADAQPWRPILDDIPAPVPGCDVCRPRVPASALSEAYRCPIPSCDTQFAPKLGGDGVWTWLTQ